MYDAWQDLDAILAIAKEASDSILDIYSRSNQFAVTAKADASPLTQADLLAHEKIFAGLSQLTPDVPILSEEQADIPFHIRQQWNIYWLIDPLDGTKEFIRHSSDFAINIALIKNHQPIFGLIYAPVSGQIFYAAQGRGAYKKLLTQAAEKIHVRQLPELSVVTVGHYYKLVKLKTILVDFGKYEVLTMGSALKFAAIAEGVADFYPRLGITSEWDTAAGQIIVEEAGGSVVDFTFQSLRYNCKESLINPPFLAMGDSQRVTEKIAKISLKTIVKESKK